jgi:hypothetical protein
MLSPSLGLRIASVFVLGAVSLVGITLPLLGSKTMINTDVFHCVKCLAAGVMLGLALVSVSCSTLMPLFVLIALPMFVDSFVTRS